MESVDGLCVDGVCVDGDDDDGTTAEEKEEVTLEGVTVTVVAGDERKPWTVSGSSAV